MFYNIQIQKKDSFRVNYLWKYGTQTVSVHAHLHERPCAENFVRTCVGTFSDMCVRVCAA